MAMLRRALLTATITFMPLVIGATLNVLIDVEALKGRTIHVKEMMFDLKNDLVKRLDRIENKLEKLHENSVQRRR